MRYFIKNKKFISILSLFITVSVLVTFSIYLSNKSAREQLDDIQRIQENERVIGEDIKNLDTKISKNSTTFPSAYIEVIPHPLRIKSGSSFQVHFILHNESDKKIVWNMLIPRHYYLFYDLNNRPVGINQNVAQPDGISDSIVLPGQTMQWKGDVPRLPAGDYTIRGGVFTNVGTIPFQDNLKIDP